MTKKNDSTKKYSCPCCGYYTLEESWDSFPTYEICTICFWEVDGVEGPDNPDYDGGPNGVSLRQAQRNFVVFGAAKERSKQHVRKPTAADRRDPSWKPLTATKNITIDGARFQDLDGFHDEVQRVLTRNFIEYGRNLDAFNDVLRGGFGVFEYEEPIVLVWQRADKSRAELGETFTELLDIIKSHSHITFRMES